MAFFISKLPDINIHNVPEIAYGIYTAAVALSLGSTLYIYFRLSRSIDEIVVRGDDMVSIDLAETFEYLTWSAFFIAATMVVGLMIVMPIIKHQARSVKSQEKRADLLVVEAITDPLTSLYNRRYFHEALGEYLREFKKIDKPLGLLMLDLDYFKTINDTHGHDVGDIVLKEVALLLKSLTREHDIVTRIGGEEFAIIVPLDNKDQVIPIAERFCNMIGKMNIAVDNVVIQPTISIGVAVSSENLADEHTLIKQADMLLYDAKNLGRNRICA